MLRLEDGAFKNLAGIPNDELIYGLEVADNNAVPPVVLAASDSKIYISRDGGDTWREGSTGLPKRVHGCDISFAKSPAGEFYYLSSYGRSVWVGRDQTRSH